ncbi:MAG: prepilin-type N-terminal cleavage/methylation domain-containing protein [Chitinispirillia bacterium]|nr:prepilin-type N-terminal cleavage/methylation domain-containing protein [Chitinispirillia bacterium]
MKLIPKKSHFSPPPCKGKSGFTIVELLVAAVIVLVAVIAVVAVVRKSTDLQITDYHRRQARAVAVGYFETTFGHNQFNMAVTPIYNASVVPQLNDAPVNVVIPVNNTFTAPQDIVLNDRGGVEDVDPLMGRISFRIAAVTQPIVINTVSRDIPIHVVTIRITWTDAGEEQQIELSKRLANVHD